MTTSSEDVLLQVPQVRYKKGDGTLYVMDERLAWIMDNRDTVSVSHKFADIKSKLLSFLVRTKSPGPNDQTIDKALLKTHTGIVGGR